MRAKVIARLFTRKEDLLPKISIVDDKILRKIEIERKALVSFQQQAFKEGRIEPMIHVMEKIQDALKKGALTPCEKIETAINLQPGVSYDGFMKDFSLKYGNFAMDLYGTEKDLRLESIARRGEIIPAVVKDVDEMIEYRKYFVCNPGLPGSIENINPNKFLRLKPKEEFPLMPIVPISPMTMKRWEEQLDIKRKQGYRWRVDKGQLYTSFLVAASFITFLALLFFLFQKDEDNWVEIERARKRRTKHEYGFY